MTQFLEGDHLFLPHHGAGTVTSVSEREGSTYLQVTFDHRDLSMMLPVEVALERGARKVIGKRRAQEVMAALKGDGETLPDNHRDRAKHVADLSVSLDARDLAGLLRDLAARRADGARLSVGEMRSFDLAREHLASELGLVREIPMDEALLHIDKAIGVED